MKQEFFMQKTTWATGDSTAAMEIGTPPEVVPVEGGTFQMGGYVSEGEEPVHGVTVSTYAIGKYPVTAQQYRWFCAAVGRCIPDGIDDWDCGDHTPIVDVTYDDAMDYCEWLCANFGGNWRLPTEAEWEYAARGGEQGGGFMYSGSDDLSIVGWFGGNVSGGAIGIGRKQANELGIHDMSGNVWEWCRDWYAADYYRVSPVLNPQGPLSGTQRVLRGGAWDEIPVACRVAYRGCRAPSERRSNSGFRVVRSP